MSVVASALGADQDLSHLCDALVGLDCKLEYIKDGKDEVVCGSDGQTYENLYVSTPKRHKRCPAKSRS